jgi:hypothetical protein
MIIITTVIILMASWGLVFGVEKMYGLDGAGFEFRQRQEIFLFSKTSRHAVGRTSH